MPRRRRRRYDEEREKADDQLSIRVSQHLKQNLITLYHIGVGLGLWQNWNEMMRLGYKLLSAIVALKQDNANVERAVECAVRKLDECMKTSEVIL